MLNLNSRKKKLIAVTVVAAFIAGFAVLLISDRNLSDDAKRQFSIAAYEGKIWKMRLLLLTGVDVNAECPGRGYALASAASGGHVDAVEFLLEHGADVNAKQKWSCTALTSATYSGRLEIVRLLLSRGADVNAACDGDSALHIAIERGHTEVAELLRQRGARDCNGYGLNKCA